MKNSNLIPAIILFSILFSSCKDNIVNNSTTGASISYIRGTVENWQSGRMNLKVVTEYLDDSSQTYFIKTLDSTFIEADRTFVFKLESPLNIPLDSFYFPSYGTCSNSPSVNPSSALFKNIQLLVYNSSDTAVGFIYLSDADTNIIAENTCDFLYSNQASSVNGARACSLGSNYHITSGYNLNFLNGWSTVYRNIYYLDSTHLVESFTSNTTLQLKWRYERFMYPG